MLMGASCAQRERNSAPPIAPGFSLTLSFLPFLVHLKSTMKNVTGSQEKHGSHQGKSQPFNLKQLRGRQFGEAAQLMHKRFVITEADWENRTYPGNILIK